MPFWKMFINQQVIGFNTKQLGVISEPVTYNMNSNSFIQEMNLVNFWQNKKLAELMVHLPRDKKPKFCIISILLQKKSEEFL